MGLRDGLYRFREVWRPEPGTAAHDLGWVFFNLVPADFCQVMTRERQLKGARYISVTPELPVVIVY